MANFSVGRLRRRSSIHGQGTGCIMESGTNPAKRKGATASMRKGFDLIQQPA
jgi:hypothetical protein